VAKRIVILGGGESGAGCGILALKQGFDVFVSDSGMLKEKYCHELDAANVAYEQGKHTEELILNADEIIKSPGIPESNELIKKLRSLNIPIISEIEFASRYTNAFIIAITGTNGKTTVTSLVYHLLQKAGLNVACGGNIGVSFARLVAEKNYDYFVLEISSFQLDDMYKFHANISVLTNITPDHLDRYDYKIENYIRSKFRITQNQTKADYFMYCADDALTTENLQQSNINAQMVPFSLNPSLAAGATVMDGTLTVQISNNQLNKFTMLTSQLALRGRHNTYNSLAAAAIGQALEIKNEVIREALTDFKNVEHRLENVATIDGIQFINDSKATNVNAAWYALECMDKPVIWIAGGIDKGNDYSMLKELVKDKVRIIICLGLENSKIHNAFSKEVDMIINTQSANEAVKVAKQFAKNGECVLLSPACASFDLFKNYEERGRMFKNAVRSL
jgi:UDP-N-acetylmuramoylalanine--D-glutamate ligase